MGACGHYTVIGRPCGCVWGGGVERLNSTLSLATRPGCGLGVPTVDAFLGCSISFVSDPLPPGNNRICFFLIT